jgi:threonine/homoserine/homoserine lactone efflux protein
VTDSLLLFVLAYGLGFVAAIPVGGSQIEMAKRAVAGHLRPAAMVVLGSVSSDVMYGTIALFGIAPFMESRWVLAGFYAAGTLVLWLFGFLTLRESRKPQDLATAHPALKSRRWAYLTGFSLAVSNPQMMLSWLLGVALAKRMGLATPFPDGAKVLFIAGGALGLGSYLAVLGAVMYRIKHFIAVGALGRVYFWLAITLFLLSLYFVYALTRFAVTGR